MMESGRATDRRREVVARLFEPDGKPRAGLVDAPPLNSADIAALFRMSERSIRLWAAKGALPHVRTLGGGRLLYPADEIAALYAQCYSDAVLRLGRPWRGTAANIKKPTS